MEHLWQRIFTRKCPCVEWDTKGHWCQGFRGRRRSALTKEEKITRYECMRCKITFDHWYGIEPSFAVAMEMVIEEECKEDALV